MEEYKIIKIITDSAGGITSKNRVDTSSTAATPTFSSVTVSGQFIGDGSVLTGIPTVSSINSHTGDTTIHYAKGSILLSELSSSAHTHPISEVVALQTSLDSKALESHLVAHSGDTSIHNSLSSLDSRFVFVSGDTITGSLIVNGDFSVLGTATTINTTELTVEDNIITINSSVTAGTPTIDSGIYSLRGSATTAAFIWSETNDQWEVGLSGSTARVIVEGDSLSLLVSGHTHPIGEVVGLQAALDAKTDVTLFNTYTGNTQTTLDAKALQSHLVSHTGDTSNPHSVTLTQVGGTSNNAFTAHTGDTTIHYTKGSINLADLGVTAHTHTLTDITDFNAYSGSVQTILDTKALESHLVAHSGLTNNPHSVTAAQVGSPTTAIFNTHTGDTSQHQNVTGGTVIGSTMYLDTNNQLSAATVDVSSLLGDTNSNFYITGGTVIGSTMYIDRNDTLSAATIDVSSLLDDTNLGRITGGTHDGLQTLTLTRGDATSFNITDVAGFSRFTTHTGDTNNPHSVTAAQVGSPTTALFNTHTGDTTVHFTKGSINLGDLGSTGHTHPISEVVSLQTNLNAKSSNAWQVFSSDTAGQTVVTAATVDDTVILSGINMNILTDNTNKILTFSASTGGVGSGEVNTALNVGSGSEIFRDKTGTTINLRTLTSTGATVTFGGNGDTINLESSAGSGTGLTSTIIAGENVLSGDLVYLKADGKYWKADNTAESTSSTELRLINATILADASGDAIIQDQYTTTGLTSGSTYWVGTSGAITTTQPTADNSIVRYVGTAISDVIFDFNPDGLYVEISNGTTSVQPLLRNVTTSETILPTDHTINVTPTGDTTQTLPTAVGVIGKIYNIKNSDTTITSTITLNTTSSQLMDEYSSGGITFQYPINMTLQSDGTNWIII